jgi:hypothetical protein
MMKLAPFVALCFMACRGVPEPRPDATIDLDAGVALPPVATCVSADETCAGTLAPESLGAGIRAVPSKSSGKTGRHYFCYPSDAAKFNGRLLVHLVGTFSDPQVDFAVSRRACAAGFAVVSPMYENERDARSVCGADTSCFEGFRREIVSGGDKAPTITVDAANSILNRLGTLLDSIAATETSFLPFKAFATSVRAGDFSNVTFSGHSQGSGHALFLARNFAAERVVLLAGPSDFIYTPIRGPAEWIQTFGRQTKTPADKIYGFISEEDMVGFADVQQSWDAVGLGSARCPHVDTGPYANTCRRVVIPAQGCTGFDAHIAVIAEYFSNTCKAGSPPHRNTDTWRFLFGVP